MTSSSRTTRRDARIRSIRRRSLLRFERLEDRLVLSTFTVTNTDDSGAGSLRQAILDANANVGADIIGFASGVTGTITLTSGELAVTDAVDLQGPGSGVVTVSGNHASRIFRVAAGVSATIRALTVTGGNAPGGGGIQNEGMLVLEGSTINGNSVPVGGTGGGILNLWGTLTVRNSTLSDNTAGGAPVPTNNGFGGGIYNTGTLTVEGSTFSGNTSSYQGGGIENRFNATLTVRDSTFVGNATALYGGAILGGATVIVERSTFVSNSAAFGGGISIGVGLGSGTGTTATVRDSTIADNLAAYYGGGIINAGGSTLTVEASTFSGNRANYGGGIANGWSGNPGTATVANSTFVGNTAGPEGGGIYNQGTLIVAGSTIVGNGDWGYGGGLYTRGPTTLSNTIVAASPGYYGGFAPDVDGAISGASSHNLVGAGNNMTGIAHGVGGNLIGTLAAPINPMLGALQNNGGPTKTMALLPGSPAIDAGANALIPAGVTTDQRGTGYARIGHGTVDIGAFELVQNHPPTITAVGSQDCTETELTVQVAAADPDEGDTLTYSVSFVSRTGAGAINDPTGFSIDSSGLFHWTPDGGQLGQYTFMVTVSDGDSSAEQSFVVTTLGVVNGVLTIVGTDGVDRITIKPIDRDADELTVRVNERDYGFRLRPRNNPDNPYTGVALIHVCGLGGDDRVAVQGNVTIPAWLNGGVGDDDLKGGGGNDVLLGGAGDDLLVGAAGRDLLIGGTGSDRLVGDAGDDLIIAGYTAYDAMDAALAAIMAEWTSARSYADRVRNLRGDASSPTFAARANGGTYLAVDGSHGRAVTVFDDGVKDTLTGEGGQDWFLFNADGDNEAKKDKVTDLRSGEFADDLDFITAP